MENSFQQNPIEYRVDYLFQSFGNDNFYDKEFNLKFMRALATTKDMHIFDAPFIRRYIDFQWKSNMAFGLYL